MKEKNCRQKKKGFSLIELLLVLSVIASLSVVAFKIFTQVENKQLADTYIQKLNIIKSNADSMFNVAGRVKLSDSSSLDSSLSAQLVSGSGYTKQYPGSVSYYEDTKTLITVQAMNFNNSNFVVIGFRFPTGMCSTLISELISSGSYLVSTMSGSLYGGGNTVTNLNNAEPGIIPLSSFEENPTITQIAESCKSSEKLLSQSTPGWNAVNIYISV